MEQSWKQDKHGWFVAARTAAEAKKKAQRNNPGYVITIVRLKEKGYGKPSEYYVYGHKKAK